jgi:CheY-like chemotaxis protein
MTKGSSPAQSNFLKDHRVLVVEDEPLVALALADTVTGHGGQVIGPFSSARQTLAALERDGRVDAALLDVRLSDGPVFELAEILRFANVPFGFATASWRRDLPREFQDAPVWQKPWRDADIVAWLKDQKPLRFVSGGLDLAEG